MRIAALSPFVDRRHGTERALAETMERLVRVYGCEVHLYSQSVQDLAVVSPSSGAPSSSPQPAIIWHRVPSLPGPHLLQFLFWLLAKRLCRLRDRWFHGVRFDAVFSPGINATDANVVLVHAVFHRLKELQDSRSSGGLRALHRSLYYHLLRGWRTASIATRPFASRQSQNTPPTTFPILRQARCRHRPERCGCFPFLAFRAHPAAGPGAPNIVLPRRSSHAPSRRK